MTEPADVSRQQLHHVSRNILRCSIPVQKLKVSTEGLLFKIKLNYWATTDLKFLGMQSLYGIKVL
jgi:hypothetical protein